MSTQSRKSEGAATQNSAETQESPSLREACLSVRLWSAPSDSGHAPSLWESDSPAACLTLDLIAASGGVPTARRDEVLVASFPTFQSAAMTARRLQWAIQGYAESEEPRTTLLALLIHSADEGEAQTVAEDAFHSLAQAASGAILLTEKASQPFDRLPGFPLQVAAGDGMWELIWTSPEGHFSRSEDEQFLAQFAAEHGVQEHAQEPPPPQAMAEPVFAEEHRTGSHRTGSYRTGSHRQPSEDEPQAKSWLKMGGLALAAAIVLAAVLSYLFMGRSTSAPVADQNTPLTQPQNEPASTTDSSIPDNKANISAATQPKHSAAKEPAENAQAPKPPKNTPKPEVQQQAQEPQQEKPERVAPKPVEQPAQKASRDSRCDLDPGQYTGLIANAEKNMGRGKYPDAIRQLGAVLACDPGNGRARDDLERARLSSSE